MCDSGGGGQQSAAADRLYGIQGDIAQDQYSQWKQNYLPLEQKTIADVGQLSDPGYVQTRVGQAQEDVGQQFTAARAMQDRRLSGVGVNPSDGSYESANRQMGLAQAGAEAGAAMSTRQGLQNQALQAQMSMAQTGRGIANSGMAGLGSAASGFAGLANSANQLAGQNAAGLGSALGTGLGAAARYGPGLYNAAANWGAGAAATAGAGAYATAGGMTVADALAAGLIAL